MTIRLVRGVIFSILFLMILSIIFQPFIVQALAQKIDDHHQESTMMFSRIMEWLKKHNDNDLQTSNEFSCSDFPCSSLEKLQEINRCCGENAASLNVLVITDVFVDSPAKRRINKC